MTRSPIAVLLASSALLTSCASTEDRSVRVRADAAFGGGKLEHTTKGTSLDDEATAAYFAFGAEAIGSQGMGGGLRVETLTSDDDLFLGLGAGTPAQAFDSEVFLHGTGVLGGDDTLVPIRFGLFFRNYTLESVASGSELSWLSFGPKVEATPDFALTSNDTVRWSMTGRFGLGAGTTVVEDDALAQEFDTTMVQVDLGVGTRLQFETLRLDVGWLHRRTNYAESDVAASLTVLEADSTFSGFTFSLGATF
ncbi:MAG: hypothetical protein ABL997_16775 [Planctomycetota bacterium]